MKPKIKSDEFKLLYEQLNVSRNTQLQLSQELLEAQRQLNTSTKEAIEFTNMQTEIIKNTSSQNLMFSNLFGRSISHG